MNNQFFSIVIPVYNSEKFLEECVQSVLKQSYDNYEIILVNDGSKDNSFNICKKLKSKFGEKIVVIDKKNGGQLSARLAGIKVATGDYIVFLDSDDFLFENALSTLSDAISKYHDDCIIYGFQNENNGEILSKTSDDHEIRITNCAEVLRKVLFNRNYNSMWRKCIKREIALFDDSIYEGFYHIRHAEDLLQSFNILVRAKSIYFIPNILYRYKFNLESVTNSIDYTKYQVDFSVYEYILAHTNNIPLWTPHDSDLLLKYYSTIITIEIKKIVTSNVSRSLKKDILQNIKRTDLFNQTLRLYKKNILGKQDMILYFCLNNNFYNLLFTIIHTYRFILG